MAPNNSATPTREPTWAGLGELVLAIKAAQDHPTKKIKRLPIGEVSNMDRIPEAKLLEQYAIIQKTGNVATDFPVGYVLTNPLGTGYAHDLANTAAELFEKRFAPKPQEPPTQQSPPEEKLHL